MLVLLAIYALTAVFFYIPQASLSAVIIHAVGDLITPPQTVYKFWMISPIEMVIFLAGVIVTVFKDIETGIYATVAATGVLILFRIAKARGQFLGTVKVHSVVGHPSQSAISSPQMKPTAAQSYSPSISGFFEFLPRAATPEFGGKMEPASTSFWASSERRSSFDSPRTFTKPFSPTNHESPRNVFLPIDYRDGTNPNVSIGQPYPGIFIYRFSEGLVYSNAGHYTDYLVSKVFKWTRPGTILQELNDAKDIGSRPWNDPGPPKNKQPSTERGGTGRPALKAIILDMSSVNNVDITSVQTLIDVRNQLDRYAAPEKVDWHFANIGNRWTKRALASAGFGVASENWLSEGDERRGRWQPVFSVAEIGEVAGVPRMTRGLGEVWDLENDGDGDSDDPDEDARLIRRVKVAPISCISRPFFHPDLEGALRSAIYNVEH